MHRRTSDSFWRSLGDAGFWLVVMLCHFLAITLSLVYIPGLGGAPIHWLALTILYWACYRPEWQPLPLLFVIGLASDLLTGSGLVGLTSFIAVALSVLLLKQKSLLLALPFWALWAVVGLLLLLWRGFEALAQGLVLGLWPPLSVWLLSAVLTALVFPVVAILLAPLRRAAFQL
jgi:rod shape-determining protein MreD